MTVKRGVGRPAKFSRQQLQTAALALVDAHGVDGLSMRSLAAALGTGPMTLYTHVHDRRDLDVLVVEAVMAKARLPRVAYDDWRDAVRALATAAWRAVRAHPNAIPLILTRRSQSPAVYDWGEALLAALQRGGRSRRRLLIAFRAVTALVMGFAQAELAGPLAVESPRAVIARFRALPAARYPRLVEVATVARYSSAEREFREGLELLLAGLADARA
ncbi:MAG: TetR/AcrR family transcriptional regulator C-terminal domain-containing protein [Deltaproteobacteria bacterium]|nr:TetR/AcrR family transcriptional regulator C-terminal domain-containing protein [Deltaproteobacteria bacterium]